MDTGLPSPPAVKILGTGRRFQTLNSVVASGGAMRDQKHRLARLIHLRPELQARHCQEPRAGNKPCLGCHCHRACSCGQGGARACQHDRDPPARPRDTPPDGHQSLLAAPTPVQTSQSSPCLFMPLPLEATKWILKLPSSLFPFLLPRVLH